MFHFNKRSLVFFDTEFTQLSKSGELISIGLINLNGETLYLEILGFSPVTSPWMIDNVFAQTKWVSQTGRLKDTTNVLTLTDISKEINWSDRNIEGVTTKDLAGKIIYRWLAEKTTTPAIMWSDCYAYDWMLLIDILTDGQTALDVDSNLMFYIPVDISTLLLANNIDPDCNREDCAGLTDRTEKHNALYDARVIREIYLKLMR